MGFKLPKMLTPPKKFKKAIKVGVIGSAVSLGGPVAGVAAAKVFDKVTAAPKSKATKAKAAGAATSSMGSTDRALADTPGAGEPNASKGLIASILSIFGL